MQGLEFIFGRRIGDAGAAADGLERLHNFLFAHRVELEHVLGFRLDLHQGQEQVLGGNEFVFELIGLAGRGFEHLHERGRSLRRLAATADARQLLEIGLDNLGKPAAVGADFFEHGAHDAILLAEQAGQQVEGLKLRVLPLLGEVLRPLDGFLGFEGEFIGAEGHWFYLKKE